MNKGGSKVFPWVTITMTSADHSSSVYHDSKIVDAGAAVGWIIKFPYLDDLCVYHAGATNVFGDMQLINDLYKPNYILLPIGDVFTMGPVEAAYAVNKFFSHAHTVIPMHYKTYEGLTMNLDTFKATIEQRFKDAEKDEIGNKKIIEDLSIEKDKSLDLKSKIEIP